MGLKSCLIQQPPNRGRGNGANNLVFQNGPGQITDAPVGEGMALLYGDLRRQGDDFMLLLRGKKSAACPVGVDPVSRRYLVAHNVFASAARCPQTY